MLVALVRGPETTRRIGRLCDTDTCGRYRGCCPIDRAVTARTASEEDL